MIDDVRGGDTVGDDVYMNIFCEPQMPTCSLSHHMTGLFQFAGHFLNNRKKKFGISRERVPFVLTEDFARVIAEGHERPFKSKQFADFMELCGKAYLSLRHHAALFITLCR